MAVSNSISDIIETRTEVPGNRIGIDDSFSIQTSVVTNTTTVDRTVGRVATDINVIPYMRGQEIEFVGYRLRPYRSVYFYFDGQPVTKFIQRPNIIETTSRNPELNDLKSGHREYIMVGDSYAKVLNIETNENDGNTRIYTTHFIGNTSSFTGSHVVSANSTYNSSIKSYIHNSGLVSGRNSSNTEIVFSMDANGIDENFYTGNVITIVNGAGAGESAEIQSYNAATRTATVSSGFTSLEKGTIYSIGDQRTSWSSNNIQSIYVSPRGFVAGVLHFPDPSQTNLKVRTGDRIFRILDNPRNDLQQYTTRADYRYVVNGLNLSEAQVIQRDTETVINSKVFVNVDPTPGPSPTPTPTPTRTNTQTPTATCSATPTETPTQTPGLTAGPTPTPTPTTSVSPTRTPPATGTATPTPTRTNTPGVTPTPTSTVSPTPTKTQSPGATTTPTPTTTRTPTRTNSPTPTVTRTPTASTTPTPTGTRTPTTTMTPSPTPPVTGTPTGTATPTQTATPTPSKTNTATPTPSKTNTGTPTPTRTLTPTNTPTPTSTITPSPSEIIQGPCFNFADAGIGNCGLYYGGVPHSIGSFATSVFFGFGISLPLWQLQEQYKNLNTWTFTDAAGNTIEGPPNINSDGWRCGTVNGIPITEMPIGTRFPKNTFVRHFYWDGGWDAGWAGPYDVSGLYAYSVFCRAGHAQNCLQIPQDPTGQTFYVDKTNNPDGIFVSSFDLFFKNKGNLPLEVQIRPTENGYPSSNTIIPGAVTVLESEDIVVTDTPNVDISTTNTRVTFSSPVYLPGGYDYSVVIITDDFDYDIYIAELGKQILGTERIVSKQPSMGSLFKSQQARTWTAIQDEDLMFRVNRCSFNSRQGTAAFTEDSSKLPQDVMNNIPYDAMTVHSDAIEINNTTLEYYYQSTSNSTGLMQGSYTTFKPDNRVDLSERCKITPANANTSFNMSVVLKTKNNQISPMVFHNRQNFVAIENQINNLGLTSDRFVITNPGSGYFDVNGNPQNASVTITSTLGYGANAYAEVSRTGEVIGIVVDNEGLGYSGDVTATIENGIYGGLGATVNVSTEVSTSAGPALARYISKTVTLKDGFDAADLRVFLTAIKPPQSDIHVYYKIRNSHDGDPIERLNWFKMEQKTSQYNYSRAGEQIEYEYRPSLTSNNITYSSGTSTYKSFNQYAIKIVLSSTGTVPSEVPYVYDLRAIALPGDTY